MSRILCPAVLVPFVVPFVVLLALLSPNSSLGATWLVNPEGTGDFPTIQIAISQSSDGDVIELTDGVFTGIGNRDILFVGKQVTVRSQSGRPEDCILDCEGSLTERHGGFAFLAGEGPLSVIEGFTIRRAWSPGNPETSGAAVRMESGSSPTIRNCVFSDCRSPHGRGGAIYAADGSTPLIEDCSFYRNSSNYDGGAIAFWISSPGIVRRCYFEENESLRGGAASIVFSSPSFESCTFVGNSTQYDGAVLFAEYYSVPVLDRCTLFANESRLVGGAISSSRYSNPRLISSIVAFGTGGGSALCLWEGLMTVECSDIYGNVGGDWVDCIVDQAGTAGNFSADPLFCDPVHGDLTLDVDSPCALPSAGCGQIGAWTVGCDLLPILTVAADGTGEYPTIQAAIDAAEDGWTVQLEDGNFTGPGNRDLDFHGKRLTLRSRAHDPENCLLECGGTESTPHRGIHLHSGEGDGTLVEGIWIYSGWTPDAGGGVRCENGASVELRNCVLETNYSTLGGAGVACLDGSVALVDCSLIGNDTSGEGGALLAHRSDLSIDGTVFRDNRATRAGGVFVEDVTAALSMVILDGNEATSDGGGVVCEGGSIVAIAGSTFYGNVGASGGSLSAGGTTSLHVSQTILSYGAGGSVECREGAILEAECCNVFGNDGGDWIDCLSGLEGTQGNFSGIPYFCAPGHGNFKVHSASPCLPDNNGCGLLIGAMGVGGSSCNGPDITDLDPPLAPLGEPFELLGPWPNPGPGRVSFRLILNREADVDATLYDVTGARVATLAKGRFLSGAHEFSWDPSRRGSPDPASGAYFLRVVAGGRTETRRVSFLK